MQSAARGSWRKVLLESLNDEKSACFVSAHTHDWPFLCQLIEIPALIQFEEEQPRRMFITLREDVPNGKTNAVFLQRSRHCQHLKVSPSQSVNFNEHPDLKQWKLITLSLHNFQRSLHMCVAEGKEMKASCSLLTINQLSKTVLQSFSASLIWSLGFCPSVDENLSNMTSPVLICRYSDMGKLTPTTKSYCISLLSPFEFDISYTCTFHKTSLCSSCFLWTMQWVCWSCAHGVVLNYWAGKLQDELMLISFWATATHSEKVKFYVVLKTAPTRILL